MGLTYPVVHLSFVVCDDQSILISWQMGDDGKLAELDDLQIAQVSFLNFLIVPMTNDHLLFLYGTVEHNDAPIPKPTTTGS